MSTLLDRDAFREAVFARDEHKCCWCGAPAVDAHHIIERRLWNDGGYYLDNGASVCEDCHLKAESTEISCEDLRIRIGIERPLLPPHLYPDDRYDKWGNPYLQDGSGRRYRGELYYDESVRRILGTRHDNPEYFVKYVKYPRTFHLPWSPGGTDDDKRMPDTHAFQGVEVVITTKMDGENCNMYSDHLHARSIDGRGGPERDWVKNLWSKIRHEIPDGWRICGENLYAKHAILYQHLPSYFLVFSIWDHNTCLDWETTVEWCQLLDLHHVPVVKRRMWSKCMVESDCDNVVRQGHEGCVVRPAGAFQLRDFRRLVGKYVRADHVPEHGRHWKQGGIETNRLNIDSKPARFPSLAAVKTRD